MTVRYTKYTTNILGLAKMSSDVVYSSLLCDFVISGAINYKKFGSVKVGSVQQVFGTNRFVITSGDCSRYHIKYHDKIPISVFRGHNYDSKIIFIIILYLLFFLQFIWTNRSKQTRNRKWIIRIITLFFEIITIYLS